MNTRFSAKTLPFLTEAGQQTDPDWLEAHQETYEEAVRRPFIGLAEALKAELQPSVPGYHFPTKGIGRIKKPANKVVSGGAHYKDWLSLSAARPSDNRFERNPHLFFGILPNEEPWMGVIVAGGLFMPSGPQLKKVRLAISENSAPFHEMFEDAGFRARFTSDFSTENVGLKVPRGFDADHPDAQWLKLKNFLVVKKLSKAEFTSAGLAHSVAEDFKQLIRLNDLLDDAIEGRWPK